MGLDNKFHNSIDSQCENALALDYASGLPSSLLVEKYQLSSGHILSQILEKPRVASLVEGHRRGCGEALVTLQKNMAMNSHRVLDRLTRCALDEDDPHSIPTARWYMDKVLPSVSYVVEEGHHTVDVEVGVQISEGAKALEGFMEVRGKGFEIEEEDGHLHEGKEFMDKRDKGIVDLGKE